MEKVLEVYFSPENLKLAYYRVLCWPERMVKDRIGIYAFGVNLEINLLSFSQKILSGNYKPQRGFKFYEPKSSGTQRTKTLLFVEDALVYQAIANVIGQRVYPHLSETENFVYGSILTPEVLKGTNLLTETNPNYFFFRFWKSLYNKFKESVIKAIEEDKATYKFETDITGFFDSIPHYNLLLTLNLEFGVEDEILDLLSECFNAWSGTKESSTPGVGIPQGPQPSYFFANLLLHPLDKDVINAAYKYYRYMDDIHIYGYSEDELMDVMVKIDYYLKGHGLSINSKKTRIQKIDQIKEDDTVKSLKRLNILGEEYSTVEILLDLKMPDTNLKLTKNLSSLSEQTNEPKDENKPTLITDLSEIITFWENEIETVEKELPNLFVIINGTIQLKDEEKTDDIDFIGYSTRYGTAIKELNELNEFNESKQTEGNPDLIKYWLFVLRKYFWRAGNFIITLQYYKRDKELKENLIELYRFGKNYESYRYHIITCLTYNFTHSDKEIRDFFKILKEESSFLVKYAIYCLIIKSTKDLQMLSTIKANLTNEKSEYLKLIVLDYWKRDTNRIESMDDLIKSVGL